MNFMTFHILGFSSSQPTVIFFKIVETNNQIIMCVYVTVGDNEGRLTFKIFFWAKHLASHYLYAFPLGPVQRPAPDQISSEA